MIENLTCLFVILSANIGMVPTPEITFHVNHNYNRDRVINELKNICVTVSIYKFNSKNGEN